MCECMCGVWCMYTWKPLICTYPCQLPSLLNHAQPCCWLFRQSLLVSRARWLALLSVEWVILPPPYSTRVTDTCTMPQFYMVAGDLLMFLWQILCQMAISLTSSLPQHAHVHTQTLHHSSVLPVRKQEDGECCGPLPPPTHTLLLASLGLSLEKRVFIFVSLPIYSHPSSLFPHQGICDDLESWARIPLINLRSKNSPL